MNPTGWRLPLSLVFLLVISSVAACEDADLTREGHPTTLVGTVWQVVTVNGRPAIVGSEPTAAFAAAEVKGSAGCNSYGGRYAYDPSTGAIQFLELGATAMACLEGARNEFETTFLQAIGQATSASIDPTGRLVLTGAGGEIVLAVAAVDS